MMELVKQEKNTQPGVPLAHAAVCSLVAFSLFCVGCSSRQSMPSSQRQDEVEVSSAKVSGDQAKTLVAQNYGKIFRPLYMYAPLENDKLQLPEMKAEEFQVVKEDPVYWYVSYEPEAGFWFEARVEKDHGTVEWITVDFAAE